MADVPLTHLPTPKGGVSPLCLFHVAWLAPCRNAMLESELMLALAAASNAEQEHFKEVGVSFGAVLH